MNDIAKQIERLLKEYAKELGNELELDNFKGYAMERIEFLASIRGEAGFGLAVEQEAINILVYSGTGVVNAADIIDAKLLAFLRGALAIAAETLGA